MKLIPLGTNGWFSSYGRQTACFAISHDDTLIILDAGSGLFRFSEPEGKKLLRNIKNIHLYLSHYHLDHTFGFYAAFKLLEGKKVTVLAETERKVFADLGREYFPIDFAREYANFSWQMISTGRMVVGDYKVDARKQYHKGTGSLALRMKFTNGKEIAYVTDSEPTYESADFIEGVDLLLHEHFLAGEEILRKPDVRLEDHFDEGHVTTAGAAIIAKEGKVGKLALIHHFPFYDDKKLVETLKTTRRLFPKTILAYDLREINF